MIKANKDLMAKLQKELADNWPKTLRCDFEQQGQRLAVEIITTDGRSRAHSFPRCSDGDRYAHKNAVRDLRRMLGDLNVKPKKEPPMPSQQTVVAKPRVVHSFKDIPGGQSGRDLSEMVDTAPPIPKANGNGHAVIHDELEAKKRLVIRLRGEEKKTFEEIANITGVSKTTASRWFQEATEVKKPTASSKAPGRRRRMLSHNEVFKIGQALSEHCTCTTAGFAEYADGWNDERVALVVCDNVNDPVPPERVTEMRIEHIGHLESEAPKLNPKNGNAAILVARIDALERCNAEMKQRLSVLEELVTRPS